MEILEGKDTALGYMFRDLLYVTEELALGVEEASPH